MASLYPESHRDAETLDVKKKKEKKETLDVSSSKGKIEKSRRGFDLILGIMLILARNFQTASFPTVRRVTPTQ